jgi:periplasmic protein TonB
MTIHWTLIRLTPIVASMLLHIVAYGAIAMVPKFTSVGERVLIANLVEPDPAPPTAPATPSRPKAPDRRTLTLPRPVETPMPAMTPPPVEPKVEETPPPAAPPPIASAPAPAVAETAPAPPAVSAIPRVAAPIDAPVTTGGDGVPAAAPTGPPAPPASTNAQASTPPGPSIAARPPDGVTQTAVPRGGYQVRPSYPHNARRLGIQGTTLLSVFVAADGRVADVVVKQSAGHPDLDHAAADAVKRWRFEPARRGSEAVAMWVLLPVEFRLR